MRAMDGILNSRRIGGFNHGMNEHCFKQKLNVTFRTPMILITLLFVIILFLLS